MKVHHSAHLSTRRRGFTLVEIMIVVVIIGLLAAMLIPVFQKIQEQTFASRISNDLRIARDAIETYELEEGGWPLDANRGEIPPGLDEYVKRNLFTENVVYQQGQFDWDGPDSDGDPAISGVLAGVSIVYDDPDDERTQRIMTEVDEILDDGDLTTGDFVYLSGDRFSFVLDDGS